MRDLNIKRMMVGIIQTQSGQIAGYTILCYVYRALEEFVLRGGKLTFEPTGTQISVVSTKGIMNELRIGNNIENLTIRGNRIDTVGGGMYRYPFVSNNGEFKTNEFAATVLAKFKIQGRNGYVLSNGLGGVYCLYDGNIPSDTKISNGKLISTGSGYRISPIDGKYPELILNTEDKIKEHEASMGKAHGNANSWKKDSRRFFNLKPLSDDKISKYYDANAIEGSAYARRVANTAVLIGDIKPINKVGIQTSMPLYLCSDTAGKEKKINGYDNIFVNTRDRKIKAFGIIDAIVGSQRRYIIDIFFGTYYSGQIKAAQFIVNDILSFPVSTVVEQFNNRLDISQISDRAVRNEQSLLILEGLLGLVIVNLAKTMEATANSLNRGDRNLEHVTTEIVEIPYSKIKTLEDLVLELTRNNVKPGAFSDEVISYIIKKANNPSTLMLTELTKDDYRGVSDTTKPHKLIGKSEQLKNLEIAGLNDVQTIESMLNIGYSRKSESHSVIAYALRLEMAFLCKYNKVYKLNAFKNPFVIKDIDSITSKYDDKKVTMPVQLSTSPFAITQYNGRTVKMTYDSLGNAVLSELTDDDKWGYNKGEIIKIHCLPLMELIAYIMYDIGKVEECPFNKEDAKNISKLYKSISLYYIDSKENKLVMIFRQAEVRLSIQDCLKITYDIIDNRDEIKKKARIATGKMSLLGNDLEFDDRGFLINWGDKATSIVQPGYMRGIAYRIGQKASLSVEVTGDIEVDTSLKPLGLPYWPVRLYFDASKDGWIEQIYKFSGLDMNVGANARNITTQEQLDKLFIYALGTLIKSWIDNDIRDKITKNTASLVVNAEQILSSDRLSALKNSLSFAILNLDKIPDGLKRNFLGGLVAATRPYTKKAIITKQIAVIGAISALMFPENGEVLVANTYKKLEVKPERIKAALER